jgi:nucleotidyltransferase/DNA polymerase involved in DNA repair
MMHSLPRTILHVDMDAFFASIEQRDTPAYRGKPVIVGAQPGHRGVVSAASYEARRFGVHSAMPINEAFARCKNGIFVRPRMDAYVEESHQIMRIFEAFSPRVEQVSVDEAFIDLAGTQRLLGTPRTVAERICSRIREERHLTASIGIAPNKFLAKVASDMHKPNGITEVPHDPQQIVQWLAPLPVGRIWGVGKKTQDVFARAGVRTIGDLQGLSPTLLQEKLGSSGPFFHQLAHGIDDRSVGNDDAAQSISREHTFERDTVDRGEWGRVLLALARDVAHTARAGGVKGHTVALAYRGADFARHTRRRTLSDATDLAKTICDTARELMDEAFPHGVKLRLIGVGITGFHDDGQLDLFADQKPDAAWQKSESAMDRIYAKFGDTAIRFGGEVGAPMLRDRDLRPRKAQPSGDRRRPESGEAP